LSKIISDPTQQLYKNLAADLSANMNSRFSCRETTSMNIRTSKVETLAKLYLDSEPAQITDATLVELCNWLWGEFQSTPLKLGL
jgi:hypothetical protein